MKSNLLILIFLLLSSCANMIHVKDYNNLSLSIVEDYEYTQVAINDSSVIDIKYIRYLNGNVKIIIDDNTFNYVITDFNFDLRTKEYLCKDNDGDLVKIIEYKDFKMIEIYTEYNNIFFEKCIRIIY